MTTKPKTLSVKNLMFLFGVTAMTIHNWKKPTMTKSALPDPLTPAKVRTWAAWNGVRMTCEPSLLLGVDVLKPGPKPHPDVHDGGYFGPGGRVKKIKAAAKKRPASASRSKAEPARVRAPRAA